MLLRSLLGPLLLVVLLDSVQCKKSKTPKIDESTLQYVESNLLSLFGFQQRPKIDRSKIEIPPAMLRLYEKQVGHPYDTIAIPRPGLHTSNANTIRSFTHIGK